MRNPNMLLRGGLLAAATLAGALALPACANTDSAPVSAADTPARQYEEAYGHEDYHNGAGAPLSREKDDSGCLGYTDWASPKTVAFEENNQIIVDPTVEGIRDLTFDKDGTTLTAADGYTQAVLDRYDC
jgi:hypothetical protein